MTPHTKESISYWLKPVETAIAVYAESTNLVALALVAIMVALTKTC